MVKVPEWATCVWKGNILSAWTWQQNMFDGSVQTFEMVKRFDSIQWIIVDWENIILPYEIQPQHSEWNYGLRGGMLEEWEIPLEAMERELLEETGMIWNVEYWKTLSKAWFIARDEYFYIIRNAQKIQEPMLDAGGEQIELKTMSFDEFISVILAPGFRNSTFANAMIREYILPGKQDEFKKVLFGK